MRKIYFHGGEQAKNVTELITLFRKNSYFHKTYSDKELQVVECHGQRRSFEDLLAIANTYFEGTSEEELMQALIDNDVRYYFCGDINKIVFHHVTGNPEVAKDCSFEMYSNRNFVEETYTVERLHEILNNIK
jgi:hypothetical protein